MTAPLRLVDPDDAALCAAFAERVAGWKPRLFYGELWWDRDGKPGSLLHSRHTPDFTSSMDAVTPHLEKWDHVHMHRTNQCWFVAVDGGDVNSTWYALTGKCATDKSLPRACTIALLRAHGVVVEFTR